MMTIDALPFMAALFDLDGTLLDSLDVWRDIDARFFASRGIAVPEDFGRQLAGMSYRESAQYTIARYLPSEDEDALIAEWIRMAEEAYAERVAPMDGAVNYVRMLKRMGVKLAIVTALPSRLYEPCLERLGVFELFDEALSTSELDAGKADGSVYALAAKRLGVTNEACVVFEDVLTGVEGAKRVGMRVIQVRQRSAEADWARMEALADGSIDCFSEMRRYHAFDENPRCVVFTARCEGDVERAYQPEPSDLVLCADGGWEIALCAGVRPALVVGDFDSSNRPEGVDTRVHPVMKDDTDTMLCLREGLRRGYERFLLVGGLGGRLDHTLANLQAMAFVKERGASIELNDGTTWCALLRDETYVVPKDEGHLSLFSLSDACTGVTVSRAKYELEDGALTNRFPLGVSNAFLDGDVTVRVREGMLLVMTVRER